MAFTLNPVGYVCLWENKKGTVEKDNTLMVHHTYLTKVRQIHTKQITQSTMSLYLQMYIPHSDYSMKGFGLGKKLKVNLHMLNMNIMRTMQICHGFDLERSGSRVFMKMTMGLDLVRQEQVKHPPPQFGAQPIVTLVHTSYTDHWCILLQDIHFYKSVYLQQASSSILTYLMARLKITINVSWHKTSHIK